MLCDKCLQKGQHTHHVLSRCNAIYVGEAVSQGGVAASTHALATAVLDQAGVSEDASLMRAAAQMYAAAACIGNDAGAAQLMQMICKDMAQTPLPARLALSLCTICITSQCGANLPAT